MQTGKRFEPMQLRVATAWGFLDDNECQRAPGTYIGATDRTYRLHFPLEHWRRIPTTTPLLAKARVKRIQTQADPSFFLECTPHSDSNGRSLVLAKLRAWFQCPVDRPCDGDFAIYQHCHSGCASWIKGTGPTAPQPKPAPALGGRFSIISRQVAV